MTVAAASHGGLLAVVTVERKRKHFLSCFSIQVINTLIVWYIHRDRLQPTLMFMHDM